MKLYNSHLYISKYIFFSSGHNADDIAETVIMNGE